ncbi:YceI family protein [Luteimonas sp. R10]|uniref:YceI family protein n=1 Tax=Luteimonas sp. R10 TaxID=3108176 RepID=UPI00308DF78C|nr:YceI family protein [Luteimonas sp. R10]
MPRSAPRLPVPALVLLAALACGGQARAQAQAYGLDPVHTRVVFAVDHAGFSKAIGTVSGSRGTLLFDPEDWTSARLEAQVPIAALDLGDERWNRAVLGRGLLDAERYPAARFVSERIEPLDADRAAVHGTLTLRGVTRPATLEVVFNALKRHPMPPFRRTVGFSATTTLSRAEFGIDAWPSMIGDTVELRIEAEATRIRGGYGQATPAPAPAAAPDRPATGDLPLPPPPEHESEQDPTP